MKTYVFLIIYIFLLFLHCSRNDTETSSPGEKKGTSENPVKVQTSLSLNGCLQKYISGLGRAQPLRKTPIIFLQNGYLLAMPLKEGQSVKKGTLIARLENERQAIALEESKASLIKAIAEFSAQSGDRQSALELLKKKPAIKAPANFSQSLDSLAQNILSGKKRAETLMAHSGLSQAHTDYRRSLLDYQKTFFYAPFSGVVGNIDVQQGEYVTAGQPVCWLYDLSKIKIEIQVLESEIPLVKVGNPCEASFSALPGKTFKGKVYAKNTALDAERHTLRVTLLLNNHSKGISPGMSASVKIRTGLEEETLLVPKEAVLERDDRFLVFVVRDSVANWCYITPGQSNDKYTQVLDSEFNLKAGEPVITEGHFALAHGARVKE